MQVPTDPDVLMKEALVVTLGVPLGLPGTGDADAKADGVDLLTHGNS